MPYGKQQDFDNPTVEDFEEKATPQEKKLWDEFLKDYPEGFQRSVMAGGDHFLFVCPKANLVVELEKFRHFSDSAGGVSGKKGDALREMGLKQAAYTYRELDTDFEGVCAAIDRAVQRALDQKSLVEIKKPERLPLDDDNEPVHKGYKITVSGEYKSDEPLGRYGREERVSTYGGNGPVTNPVADEEKPAFGFRGFKEEEEKAEPKGAEKKETRRAPSGRKHIFIAASADIVGDVHIGNGSSVWYQAVVRGDQQPITIGENSNVQDGSVVHVSPTNKTTIGDGVTIGHNCTIHGCTIEDDVLVGMGSTVLNGAVIGKETIIGAGSLVTQNVTIPAGSLAFGRPAKVVRPLTEDEKQSIRDNAEEYIRLMDEEPGQGFYETGDGVIIIRK
jgi:carbonic anhydrase/acetyltransferase-like protein (isoleucine patch superfamily)/very-short-patch-repair endonuclease